MSSARESTVGAVSQVSLLSWSEVHNPKALTTCEYQLAATTKTSTFERELNLEGRERFALVWLTVADTAFGGSELVAVLRRTKRR